MSRVEEFLTTKEEQEIIAAIQTAEKNTSGEIRIHIEATSKIDPYKRALDVFYALKMDTTKDANGVLIYVAVDDKKFAIYGDKGIHSIVSSDFWNATKNVMQHHFKSGNFKQGIVEGILKAGSALQDHFPYKTDDKNELSNEISKG